MTSESRLVDEEGKPMSEKDVIEQASLILDRLDEMAKHLQVVRAWAQALAAEVDDDSGS